MQLRDAIASSFVTATALFIVLLSACSNAYADAATQRYGNPTLQFELQYPSELIPADSHNPISPLLLLSKGAMYPSFNVVVEPQALTSAELTLAGQAERVVAAYRQVGLTDAVLIEKSEILLNDKRAFSFLLRYGTKGQTYDSSVTIVPRSKFLYTLTFIDSSSAFGNSRRMLQVILNSFVSSDGTATSAPPITRPNFLIYSSLFVCLAFFMALALRMRRRRMPS